MDNSERWALRGTPIALQTLCCRKIAKNAQWTNLEKFSLPPDTFKYFEDYFRDHPNFSKMLSYIYTYHFKETGIAVMNLRKLDEYTFLRKARADLKFVVKLDLSHTNFVLDQYDKVLARCANLQFLNLSNCGFPERWSAVECLEVIAYRCPKLQQLNISNTAICPQGVNNAFTSGKFTQLKELECTGMLDDTSIATILRICPQLQILKSEYCMEALNILWNKGSMLQHYKRNPLALVGFGTAQSITNMDMQFYLDLKLICPSLTEFCIDLEHIENYTCFKRGDISSNITCLRMGLLDMDSGTMATMGQAARALNLLEMCGSKVVELDICEMPYLIFADVLSCCSRLRKLSVLGHRYCYSLVRLERKPYPGLEELTLSFAVNDTTDHSGYARAFLPLFPKLKDLTIRSANLIGSPTDPKATCYLGLFFQEFELSQLMYCRLYNVKSTAACLCEFLTKAVKYPNLKLVEFTQRKIESDHQNLCCLDRYCKLRYKQSSGYLAPILTDLKRKDYVEFHNVIQFEVKYEGDLF